jgi:hypothetical protein
MRRQRERFGGVAFASRGRRVDDTALAEAALVDDGVVAVLVLEEKARKVSFTHALV